MNMLSPKKFILLLAFAASLSACQSSSNQPVAEQKPNTLERDRQKIDDSRVLAQAPVAVLAPPPVESRVYSLKSEAAKRAVSGAAGAVMAEAEEFHTPLLDNEKYAHVDQNGVMQVAEHPVSTFSIDVDTGAYSNVRRMLNAGQLPQQDAVRIEEMINYFTYDYPLPQDKNVPFSMTTEIAPSPWNQHTHLLQIGIKGQDIATQMLPPANLVFLIDVSGSMSDANRLPLLQSALKILTKQLREQDRVAIVVYAGASGVVLEPTNDKGKFIAALNRLQAGGSTNGGGGD